MAKRATTVPPQPHKRRKPVWVSEFGLARVFLPARHRRYARSNTDDPDQMAGDNAHLPEWDGVKGVAGFKDDVAAPKPFPEYARVLPAYDQAPAESAGAG